MMRTGSQRVDSLAVAMGATSLGSVALLAHSQAPKPAPATEPIAASSAAATVQPISHSLGLVVYPAKGQSANQQSVDDQECYDCSQSQTGIDPQGPPPVATPAPSRSADCQRVRSAARGAAAGAVIGEVASNDADEGAKVGAAGGVIAGGRQARENKRTQEQPSKDQVPAAQAEQRATFKKALGTCMQGRGYTTG